MTSSMQAHLRVLGCKLAVIGVLAYGRHHLLMHEVVLLCDTSVLRRLLLRLRSCANCLLHRVTLSENCLRTCRHRM